MLFRSVAAGLFASVIGKLESFGLFPPSPTIWDASLILSDDSMIGGFLRGLVGYRARPSVLEAVAYGAYLVAVGILFFRASARTRQPSATGDRDTEHRSEGALTSS